MYIDTKSSIDIIYEHCFCLLPNRRKGNLKHATGQLTGFTGHNLWSLGTIYLPFTLTSYDKTKRKITLIEFVVIRHPTEHNNILGRTSLIKFGAIPSTMHAVVIFNTTEGPGTTLTTPSIELRCYKIMQLKEITQETKKVTWRANQRK